MTQAPPARVALITGGSRGLGRSMALALAERGVDVLITYRSQRAEAEAVVVAARALGRRAEALALDLSATSGIEGFAAGVAALLPRAFGRDHLDLLVNNAGVGLHRPFAETTEADLDAMYTLHFKAPFLLTRALLPLIADGGAVLNLSTGLTRFAFPGYAAYAAMKGAVEVLTRYQARELGARGVRVNVLAPGAIETDFGGGAVRDNPEVNRMIAQLTALGRVGLPEDIGGLAALLLSPEAGWVNGQRIEAAGGIFL